jgi:polysaccharide export outer membrane protein
MFRLPALILVGLLALLSLYGCAQGPLASASATDAAASRVIEDYRLGIADKVRVTVFGEESLSGEFVVGSNGKLSLPLIGETQAAGFTIGQLQDEISRGYRQGYLNEPRVSAEVLNYRPFYILGEVEKPGEYPYTNGLTILNAVATAGGFTYRADMRRIFVKRAEGDAEEEFLLTTSTRIAPGDTIRIRERLF